MQRLTGGTDSGMFVWVFGGGAGSRIIENIQFPRGSLGTIPKLTLGNIVPKTLRGNIIPKDNLWNLGKDSERCVMHLVLFSCQMFKK